MCKAYSLQIDHLTNWVAVKAVIKANANIVADLAYSEINMNFRTPGTIIFDCAMQFRSKALENTQNYKKYIKTLQQHNTHRQMGKWNKQTE
ncbi:hypothetical protein BB560_003444 [Smittium megazygosporum]|uniref:Integrase catalytic domain-containing protein n=1 Tax=Smittium megazygosporum TaxID=133381 RepID=A0A2T9ZC33_9FUNG|nr:hypothetical protein BB560_003444 [Smittium megazygosporum]